MNDFLQAEQSNVLHKPQSMGGDSLAMTLKKKREVETMLQQEREAAGFGYNASSSAIEFTRVKLINMLHGNTHKTNHHTQLR